MKKGTVQTQGEKRKKAQENAKKSANKLIKNGKFFIAPQKSTDNFKVLFARLAAEGAGRPVDENGFADGPWTAETMADAISSFEGNEAGIEVRAVQTWFQDNDSGISDANIRWVARIFGCGDPEATSRYQAILKASKEQLAVQRREKRRSKRANKINGTPMSYSATRDEAHESSARVEAADKGTYGRKATTLAESCERILSGATTINLQIGYWLVFCGLGLMNYVVGTLSVTYSPVEGIDKQVGFIWAPTLTVLPLVVLPLFIFFVSNLNTYWKRVGRANCTSERVMAIYPGSDAAWYEQVNDFSFSFWSIAIFCFLFVFGFQWAGIYMPAYLSGDSDGVQIDRYLVTLVRPDVISTSEAIVLSAVGYIYTASYISIFMFGLLFSLIITQDYQDICTTSEVEGRFVDKRQLRKEGQKIVWGVFRTAVFALWLATLIKLQITYLSSDSEDIVTWLRIDAAGAMGSTARSNGWLENTSISHFTTFMMMIVSVMIFVVCIIKMRSISARLALYDSQGDLAQDKGALAKMLSVIGFLSLNFVLVGCFTGFSLLLAASAVVTTHVLAGPRLRTF